MSIGKQALMAVTGLSAGVGVAGGLFALMIALGLVSEFADQTRTARYIFWYEDAISVGAILGNIISVYQTVLPLGQAGAGIFGLFSGIFVGAWAMALTEIVNIVPIFTRRMDLRRGLGLMIASMAGGTDGWVVSVLLFPILGGKYNERIPGIPAAAAGRGGEAAV